MALPKLVISRIEFDPVAIADALRIKPDQAIAALQDGRGVWPFSEIWGERLYEFIKHSNTNQPFSDGAIALEQLRDVNISVKSLTRAGIKFQCYDLLTDVVAREASLHDPMAVIR